jgi:GH24 family phage-related lysozyme (muramidase)
MSELAYGEISQSEYLSLRYAFIKQFEESGSFSPTAYLDTATPPIPTIGLGFNLTLQSNLLPILSLFGFNADPLAQSPTEKAYISAIRGALTTIYPSNAALQATLNAIMAAADANLPSVNRSSFSFNTESEVEAVFAEIAETIYEQKILAWEQQQSLVPSGSSVTSIPSSLERIAIFSLAYNTKDGQKSLLGAGLASAIEQGNRAEAWYEIRYNSNAGKDVGVAKRRYAESELFGLYDADGLSVDEAKDVFQSITLHRQQMLAYENLFAAQVSAANADLNAIAGAFTSAGVAIPSVGTLSGEVELARQMYIADLQTTYTGFESLLSAIDGRNILLDPSLILWCRVVDS